MSWLRKVRFKLGALFSQNRFNAEMEAEMRTHLELRTEKNIAAGMSPEEARFAALRSFGGLDQLKERARRQRGWVWPGQLIQDLRYAFRNLLKTPCFTLVVVLTLALCIGANSAVFSVIDAILLKSYPWPGSERTVYIYNTYPLMGLPNAGVSIPDYLDRRAIPGIADSAMYAVVGLNLADTAEPAMIYGLKTTPSLFPTLQSSAAIGRVFNADDARPDAPATIVLSHALWKTQFASSRSIVGRTIRVNDRPVTVIGVMREGFYFPTPEFQAWIPFAFTSAQRADSERGHEYARMIARLTPGVSMASIQRELDLIQAQNAQRMPESGKFWRTSGFDGHASGFLEANVENVRGMLWLIQAGVLAALLIGCANVAGLLLARTAGREKELAIRVALGASRGRVARQLLTESMVLFVAGGLLGLMVAVWGIDALQLLGLSKLPRGFGVRVDPAVFAFTLVSAVLTGFCFGALPAWSVSRNNPCVSLKEAGARGSAGRRTQRLRAVFVVSEIALAVMLVATASLLIKSFIKLEKVDPGFAPGGVLAAGLALSPERYGELAKILTFHDAVRARLIATPGVSAAGAAASSLPFSDSGQTNSYTSPDIVSPANAPPPHALICVADVGYLKALGLTLLRGRWFVDGDTANSPPVVVVDRVMVDRYWKDEDPIGKRIFCGDSPKPRIVVGVVGTVKNHSLDEKSEKETLYFPLTQPPHPKLMFAQPMLIFVARTAGDPGALAASVRDAVRSVEPAQPVFDVVTMTQRMTDVAQSRRAPAVLLSVCGGLAIVLAMLGVYGVLAFAVAQRTTEFGIRIALGATRANIVGLVLKSGLILAALGIALGLAGYLVLNRLLATLLFGISSTDPLMLAVAPLLLAVAALAACLVPAVRATMIEPLVALRTE